MKIKCTYGAVQPKLLSFQDLYIKSAKRNTELLFFEVYYFDIDKIFVSYVDNRKL